MACFLLINDITVILISSNETETSRSIGEFLSKKGIGARFVSRDEFTEGLTEEVSLVIYDTDSLLEKDVVNITLAKKKQIPLVLIIPYLPGKSLDEVSRLWRGGYLRDCLIKPINMDDFLKYIPESENKGVEEGGGKRLIKHEGI